VKVNGKLCYLWRAVDHEGEVLEAVVTARRDKAAALKLLKRIVKKYEAPRSIIWASDIFGGDERDRCCCERHEVGGRLTDRAFERALGMSPAALAECAEAATKIPADLQATAPGQPQSVFNFVLGADSRGRPSGSQERNRHL